MAYIAKSPKFGLWAQFLAGTLGATSITTAAIAGITTITALAANELQIVGADGKDVEIMLGDNDAGEDFHIADVLGVELFKVNSAGVITLENGATLDNSSGGANLLTITEATVDINGNLTAGTVTSDAGVSGTTGTFSTSVTTPGVTATAGGELLLTGLDNYDVEVKLGNTDGGEDFHIADSGNVELFKVASTGLITLENGATILNTSADVLTITEATVDIDGACTATSFAADGSVSAVTSVSGATVAASGAATVGTTLTAGTSVTTPVLETTHTTPGIGKTDKLATYIYDRSVDYTSFTFIDADVTAAADTITEADHGLATGTPVDFTTDNDLPDPLVINTVYYVNAVDTATIKLYDTYANAVTGGAPGLVDLVADGTGNHTLHANRLGEVRLGLTTVSTGTAMPDNAIIVGGGIDVVTAFTDTADDGTTNTEALMFVGANDFFSAANWSAGLKDAVPDETFSSGIKMTAATYPVLTIAADSVKTGKAIIYVRYVQSV